MKHILILITLVLTSLSASSQFATNNLIIDLSAKYTDKKSEFGVPANSYKNYINAYEISSCLGYNLNNNFIIGFGVNYNNIQENRDFYTTLKSPSYSSSTETATIEIEPLIFSKYIMNISHKLFFSVRTEAGINFTNADLNGSNPIVVTNNKNTAAVIELQPGIEYFVTKNFGLSLKFGGIKYVLLNSTVLISDSFNFNINPSNWSCGLYFRFGKNAEPTINEK
jgi:hypothetical protein